MLRTLARSYSSGGPQVARELVKGFREVRSGLVLWTNEPSQDGCQILSLSSCPEGRTKKDIIDGYIRELTNTHSIQRFCEHVTELSYYVHLTREMDRWHFRGMENKAKRLRQVNDKLLKWMPAKGG